MNEEKTKKPIYKRWWFIVIAVVVVLGFLGSLGDDSAPTAATDNTSANSAEPQKEIKEKNIEPEVIEPEITVTSTELTKAYADNEVAADAKYKGKLIEISGTITGIDNGILDSEMIVKLSDGEYDISGPYCYTNKSEYDKVLVLTKGQQITMIGTGGSATLGSPVLKKCTIK